MTDTINAAFPQAPLNITVNLSPPGLHVREPKSDIKDASAEKEQVSAKAKAPLVDPDAMRELMAEAIATLNEQMERNGRGLKFSIDEDINRHIITVSNTQTGEVVRQIPTEVIVRLAHSIEEIKGLLSDETV
jgi:flagellar protein FlaG